MLRMSSVTLPPLSHPALKSVLSICVPQLTTVCVKRVGRQSHPYICCSPELMSSPPSSSGAKPALLTASLLTALGVKVEHE